MEVSSQRTHRTTETSHYIKLASHRACDDGLAVNTDRSRSCKAPQTVLQASETAKIKRKLLLILTSPCASCCTTGRNSPHRCPTPDCHLFSFAGSSQAKHRTQETVWAFAACSSPVHSMAKHHLHCHNTSSPQQALLSSLHSPFTSHNSLFFYETHFLYPFCLIYKWNEREDMHVCCCCCFSYKLRQKQQ